MITPDNHSRRTIWCSGGAWGLQPAVWAATGTARTALGVKGAGGDERAVRWRSAGDPPAQPAIPKHTNTAGASFAWRPAGAINVRWITSSRCYPGERADTAERRLSVP